MNASWKASRICAHADTVSVPGPVRPARPERWLQAAWLQGNTCRASMPILGLYTCTASQQIAVRNQLGRCFQGAAHIPL